MNITTWAPDTCNCTLRYQADDTGTITFLDFLQICDAHFGMISQRAPDQAVQIYQNGQLVNVPSWSGDDAVQVYAQIQSENSGKNSVYPTVMAALLGVDTDSVETELDSRVDALSNQLYGLSLADMQAAGANALLADLRRIVKKKAGLMEDDVQWSFDDSRSLKVNLPATVSANTAATTALSGLLNNLKPITPINPIHPVPKV